MEILDQNRDLWPYSTVSAWNDPDMLEVGVVRDNMQLTVGEARTHFTFWTALNSPLLLGNDLRNIAKPEYKWIVDIVANKDAIAVNQDKGAKQVQLKTEHKSGTFDKDACTSSECTRTETWTRPLKGIADFAAILFNRAGLDLSDSKFKKEKMTITWAELGVSATQKMKVRDVWKGQDLGVFTSSFQTDEIAQHEAAYILFSFA
jgi:alpha-galactosidase